MDSFERSVCEFVTGRGRAWALKKSMHKETAEDALQNCAYKALRGRASFEEGTNLAAWLYRILQNELMSIYRRGGRSRESGADLDDLPGELVSRPSTQDGDLDHGRIMAAVGQLPPSQRAVMVGIIEGLTYDEMAWMQGCSVGTIKSRLWRARQAVIEALGEHAPPGLANLEEQPEDYEEELAPALPEAPPEQ